MGSGRATGIAVGVAAVAFAVITTGCSEQPQGPLPPPPPPITADELTALTTSGGPSVVNVWASWCLPCRSEAPLLAEGAARHPDVAFIGLNVQDTPSGAQSFLAEYFSDAEIVHYSDESGSIPNELGAGRGVPVTVFYDADGTIVAIHRGIIDEPTLARYLDEIDR